MKRLKVVTTLQIDTNLVSKELYKFLFWITVKNLANATFNVFPKWSYRLEYIVLLLLIIYVGVELVSTMVCKDFKFNGPVEIQHTNSSISRDHVSEVVHLCSKQYCLFGVPVWQLYTHKITFYSEKVSVVNESFLCIMKGKDSWFDPDRHASSTQSLDLITFPLDIWDSWLYANGAWVLSCIWSDIQVLWAKVMSNPGKYDAHASYSSSTHGSPTPGGGGKDGGDKKMLCLLRLTCSQAILCQAVCTSGIYSVSSSPTQCCCSWQMLSIVDRTSPDPALLLLAFELPSWIAQLWAFLQGFLVKKKTATCAFGTYQNQNRLSCHSSIL